MRLKARCLFRAGILTASQRAAVARKANQVLTRRTMETPREPKAA
jgi:hypothetical protein